MMKLTTGRSVSREKSAKECSLLTRQNHVLLSESFVIVKSRSELEWTYNSIIRNAWGKRTSIEETERENMKPIV